MNAPDRDSQAREGPRNDSDQDSDFERRLAHLEPPRPLSEATRSALKITLVNARVSSWIGVALVAIPTAFILGVVLHYGLGIAVPGFDAFERLISVVEHTRAIRFLSPVVLAGAPLLALALNLVAILHATYDRARRELILTLTLRPLNLTVIALALGIVAMLFVHIVSERARHGR